MLIKMREKSRITLPEELVEGLGLSEGDGFEAVIRDGGIFLYPVFDYPDEIVTEISRILEEHMRSDDPSIVFGTVEEVIASIGKEKDS